MNSFANGRAREGRTPFPRQTRKSFDCKKLCKPFHPTERCRFKRIFRKKNTIISSRGNPGEAPPSLLPRKSVQLLPSGKAMETHHHSPRYGARGTQRLA
jgi:hypothetical protein